jgi:hypothetical protein
MLAGPATPLRELLVLLVSARPLDGEAGLARSPGAVCEKERHSCSSIARLRDWSPWAALPSALRPAASVAWCRGGCCNRGKGCLPFSRRSETISKFEPLCLPSQLTHLAESGRLQQGLLLSGYP